jgi:hypothetical protein
MSKIVATQGGGRFLLDLETEVDGKRQAQIVDTKAGKVWPQQFIQSILARGYWTDCTKTPEETAAILAQVRPVSQPA